MAISIGVRQTVRFGAVLRTSLKAFGRHAVAFIILSVFAHVPGYLWSSTLAVDYAWALPSPWADWLVPVVTLLSVLIAYGATIYVVLQDLAGRPVAIAKAVAIATRRLLPLMLILVAVMTAIRLALPVFPEPRTEAAVIRFAAAFLALSAISWLVMATYLMAATVCVAESAGVGTALWRSRCLTRGYRWRISMIIFLVSALELAIMMTGSAVAFSLALVHQGWEVSNRNFSPRRA